MKYFTESLFDGKEILSNKVITAENGKVISVVSGHSKDADLQISGLLAPAYIDVQVNGGGGMLFNNQPTVEALECIAIAHQQYGTGSLLPTLITDDIGVMKHAADAISQSMEKKIPGIIGVVLSIWYLQKLQN